MKQRVIFIVGPTAAGKSRVGIILAKRLGAEIISCDSMQAYRGMDILSAKPTRKERAVLRHHLIDILEPSGGYNAVDFSRRASTVIADIIQRDNVPLLVGGSGLYVKALLDGIFKGPGKDEDMREDLRRRAESFGREALYNELKEVDPSAAEKIHPNDLRRIIRALEVYKKTKQPISKWKEAAKGLAGIYETRLFGLRRVRADLYNRIDERVDGMFEAGIVEEVKRLRDMKIGLTAGQALGYKEIAGYLDGKYALDEAKALLKKNTRHFARRQMTWFRPDKRVEWIDVDEGDSAEETAHEILRRLSSGTCYL